MSRLGGWGWRYDFQQQEGDRQWEISEKDGRAYYLRLGFKAPPHQLLCSPEQKNNLTETQFSNVKTRDKMVFISKVVVRFADHVRNVFKHRAWHPGNILCGYFYL